MKKTDFHTRPNRPGQLLLAKLAGGIFDPLAKASTARPIVPTQPHTEPEGAVNRVQDGRPRVIEDQFADQYRTSAAHRERVLQQIKAAQPVPGSKAIDAVAVVGRYHGTRDQLGR